jgi:hypothetical protein
MVRSPVDEVDRNKTIHYDVGLNPEPKMPCTQPLRFSRTSILSYGYQDAVVYQNGT